MKKSFPILFKKIFLITLLIPYALNCMQSNIEIKENENIILKENLVLNKKITFKGSCTLQGNSNVLTLGDDALISILLCMQLRA